ncbi:MAG TPA: DMT family transporter [Hyphomonas sp.]|nr:DMT family transporter [Hyphomonas sp.]HRX72804.1 DMT family transporter [Hyphomonas sp.]
MSFRDFMLLFGCCLVWGLNLVLTRWVVADLNIPPLFFAAIRFAGVALFLIPFLRPVPEKLFTLFLISIMIGSLNFALLFMGLRSADASAVAVTGQLGVPISTLMSMAFLGERIGWRRGLGIMLSFAGVVLIAFDPTSFRISVGLLFVVASAFIGSYGGILMKKMPPLTGLQVQAWVGLFSFAPLFAVSFLWEKGQVGAYLHAGWPVWLASLFAICGVSIFGHGAFYTLIKKYDVSMLSPLTLMTPIWGVVFGVILLNEPISPRLLLGATIALAGVFMIAVRQNTRLPEAALGKKMSGES